MLKEGEYGKDFTEWLISQKMRNGIVGFLAQDVARDPTWPKGEAVGVMREYLFDKHACQGAFDALNAALKEFSE